MSKQRLAIPIFREGCLRQPGCRLNLPGRFACHPPEPLITIKFLFALLSGHWGQYVSAICLFLLIGGCSSTTGSPQQAILGQWVNEQGGEVYFYESGAGFIPGKAGAINIPDVKFTYRFLDDTHLSLDLPGQPTLKLEITIAGDTMTWRGVASRKEFVYTRHK